MNTKSINSLNLNIFIQNATKTVNIPTRLQFKKWITLALRPKIKDADITIRIVTKTESAKLNLNYRDKMGPTNVLSFPYQIHGKANSVLGDLVICSHLVKKEAKAENKKLLAHWAHLIVHGVLHLQGYDHIKVSEAQKMERLETKILKQLGFRDPYSSVPQGQYENLG